MGWNQRKSLGNFHINGLNIVLSYPKCLVNFKLYLRKCVFWMLWSSFVRFKNELSNDGTHRKHLGTEDITTNIIQVSL